MRYWKASKKQKVQGVFSVIEVEGYVYRFGYDTEIIEKLKWIPAHHRKWLQEEKLWWISNRYESIMDRILDDPIFDPWTEIGGNKENNEESYKRDDTKNGMEFEFDVDYARLFLLDTAPESLVRAAYKHLISLYHPQSSHSSGRGDNEIMVNINRAFENICKKRSWRK